MRLVDRLIAETRTSKPGTSASDKLRDTAVKVLTGRHAAQARSWQKDADRVEEELSQQAPDPQRFRETLRQFRADGVSRADEVVVLLSYLRRNPDLLRALGQPTPGRSRSEAQALHNPSNVVNRLPQQSGNGLERSFTGMSERSDHSERSSVTAPSMDGVSPLKPTTNYAPLLTNAVPVGLPGSSTNGLSPSIAGVGDLLQAQAQLPQNLQLPPTPKMPEWFASRPFLTGTNLFEAAGSPETLKQRGTRPPQELGTFSRPVQELVVLEDVLYAFMGWEGKYIKLAQHTGAVATPSPGGCFAVEGQLDSSMHELLKRMLPICEHVVIVQRFVETRSAFEWGRVCHAVAAAMRQVLQDWQLMVSQLEHQLHINQLTLQALWYYCQPPLASLQLLAAIAAEAAQQQLRGCALLDLLWQRNQAVAGDAQARRLVQKLLQAACRPYFQSLEQWLCEGVVHDPHAEFMIVEHPGVTREGAHEDVGITFWNSRYALRTVKDANGAPVTTAADAGRKGAPQPVPEVPLFLSGSRVTILTTGKYLNAIRECGRDVERSLPPETHLEFDEEGRYERHIQAAFQAASASLLGLLQRELGLRQALTALKQYMLLSQGDMLGAFLDSADEELQKSAVDVSEIRLQSLLDLAVRSSSVAGDPHSERLQCSLSPLSLLGMLKDLYAKYDAALGANPTAFLSPVKSSPSSKPEKERAAMLSKKGMDAFILKYKVEWPMSIVVSKMAMLQYQLIFRHLFELKQVERQLNAAWQLWAHPTLQRAYSVCQQLMHFFHQYLLYVTFEVIEHHSAFLRRVLKGCLLTRQVRLLRTLLELKLLATKFSEGSIERLRVDFESIDQEVREDPSVANTHQAITAAKAERAADLLQSIVQDERFQWLVADCETNFSEKFRDFCSGLQEVHRKAQDDPTESREDLDSLLNLIDRLDFNSFFNPKPDIRQLFEAAA
eukprot:jgi/Astpho2/4229/Aster-05189